MLPVIQDGFGDRDPAGFLINNIDSQIHPDDSASLFLPMYIRCRWLLPLPVSPQTAMPCVRLQMDGYWSRHDIRIFGYRAERCAKSYATGRKNVLFHDTVKGARTSAIIYSLVENAKANHLNVFQYLYTLLLYMPDYKEEPAGVEAMMPWSEFIKERCTRVMDTETETPENRGQIPL